MNITIEELGCIITDFVRVGYNSAVADYDPPQDRLRQSEVKKWLKFRHVEFKTFQSLVDKGLIHSRRSGVAVNSPLFYSKAEIQKALSIMRINRYFVNDKNSDYGRQEKND
jgi:hypothetical protein